MLGTAGSGKTTMAIHRAAYVADERADHGGPTLLLTFNRTLVTYLEHLRPPELRNVDVRTYHHFARGYLGSRGWSAPGHMTGSVSQRWRLSFPRENTCSYHGAMVPNSWVIPPESHRPARTCCRCGRSFAPEDLSAVGPGWSPLRDGWRCPRCTRAYEARIDRLARRLIAEHEQRRWMHAHEHAPSTECVFCDVIRRAAALLLERTR